jgi:hypothetical protein
MLLDEGTANTTQPIIAQECRQWKGRLRRSTRTRSVPRVSEFVLTGNPETIFWLCTKCRVTGKLTIRLKSCRLYQGILQRSFRALPSNSTSAALENRRVLGLSHIAGKHHRMQREAETPRDGSPG